MSNEQIKKSFKPTSMPKNCGLKFMTKSYEKTYQIRANGPTYTK